MSSNIFEEKMYIYSFYSRDSYEQMFTGCTGFKSTWNPTGFYSHIWLSLTCPDGGWWEDACMGRLA